MNRTEKLWGIKELANYLDIPVQTVYQWRSKRYGPPGIRVGKHVRYRPADVERWLTSQTSEVA